MRQFLFLVAALAVGCGSSNSDVDAGGGDVDAGGGDVDAGAPAAPTCAAYCTAVMGACTGANAMYTSMDSCLAVCAGLPVGTAADMAGNTVGCRTYHAGAAAGDPATHCMHAGPGGAGVCGNDCEGFCAVALHSCTGDNSVYAAAAACMTECAGFATTPAYSTTTTSGNSFACRLYHLTAAASDAATHCDHIGLMSPVCN